MARKKVKEAAQAYRIARTQKKTLNLDQLLLDDARAALGVATETEAVHRALEQIVRRQRQEAGIREFLKLGPIDATRIE
jgi:Arc/MetJ family transcription regulator